MWHRSNTLRYKEGGGCHGRGTRSSLVSAFPSISWPIGRTWKAQAVILGVGRKKIWLKQDLPVSCVVLPFFSVTVLSTSIGALADLPAQNSQGKGSLPSIFTVNYKDALKPWQVVLSQKVPVISWLRTQSYGQEKVTMASSAFDCAPRHCMDFFKQVVHFSLIDCT